MIQQEEFLCGQALVVGTFTFPSTYPFGIFQDDLHASVLIYKGANIHSVSKRLGHSDIQTTLDHYAHVLKEMEERDEEIAINIYSS
ncbi:hypothetical protein ACIQZG_10195 [Lysinibacillus sp. NPDC096418]|uniref:hypothetical protein n=1 Tax=Lysinibacillus sp. NPDC096418 TaxID=3364138 RepID=UPI00381817CE